MKNYLKKIDFRTSFVTALILFGLFGLSSVSFSATTIGNDITTGGGLFATGTSTLATTTLTGDFSVSGILSALGGLKLPFGVPADTTNKLYNNSGTLTFNGSAVDTGVIDITYADLTAAITAGTLTPGAKYRMAFQSVQYIPNTSPAVCHTGTAEHLILTATSNSTIDAVAHSEEYPQDTLWYSTGDLFNSALYGGCSGLKGTIYRRVDNVMDIDIPWDWRNNVFRLWRESDGGPFTALTDTGFGYQDWATLGDPANNTYRAIRIKPWIEGSSRAQQVIVFQNYAVDLDIDYGVRNLRVAGSIYETQIGCYHDSIVIYGEFEESKIGNYSSSQVYRGNVNFSSVGNNVKVDFHGQLENSMIDNSDGTMWNIPGDVIGQRIGPSGSTMSATIAYTGSTLNLSGYEWAGVINISGIEADPISTIANLPAFDVEIHPAATAGYIYTVPTAGGAVTSSDQIVDDIHGVAWDYNTDAGDYFVVRKQTITNGNGTFTVARVVRAVGGSAN